MHRISVTRYRLQIARVEPCIIAVKQPTGAAVVRACHARVVGHVVLVLTVCHTPTV